MNFGTVQNHVDNGRGGDRTSRTLSSGRKVGGSRTIGYHTDAESHGIHVAMTMNGFFG